MLHSIIQTRGIDVAIHYSQLELQKNNNPLFTIYVGELYLWAGRYIEAGKLL